MSKPLRNDLKWKDIRRLMTFFALLFSTAIIAQDCDSRIEIVGSNYVCEGEEIIYSVRINPTAGMPSTFIDPSAYSWTLLPAGSGTIVGNTSSPTLTVVWDQGDGVFDVILTLTDYQPGCAGSFDDTLAVEVVSDFGIQLACNDTVQVSLGTDCEAVITPDMVLEGGRAMNEDFTVNVEDATGSIISGALIDGSYAGEILKVSVVHNCSGNSCWGWLRIEDKIAPALNCEDAELGCQDNTQPTYGGIPGFPYSGGSAPVFIGSNTYRVSGIDACGNVLLTYSDDVDELNCIGGASAYIRRITRTWVATDESGNTDTCVQTINILPMSLGNVDCPQNWDGIAGPILECDGVWPVDQNGHPHPSYTGYPTGVACSNLDYDYVDFKISTCDANYKLIREWLIADWCTGRQVYCNQIIKVADIDPPKVSCPPNDTFSVRPFECLGDALAPNPLDYIVAGGECSSNVTVEVTVKRGAPDCTPPANVGNGTTDGVEKLANGDYTVHDLPLGCSWIVYTYTDGCGNSSSCSYDVFIKEDKKPVAVCDQHTVVTLSTTGTAKVYAKTFDDGSYDNCGEIDSFQVRRMVSGDCPTGVADDTEFRDYVEFCCADAGDDPVMVVLRVYDASGNYNECMVEVTIVDKTSATFVCPPGITVSCGFDFADINIFGQVRTSEAEREDIYINDSGNPNTSGSAYYGRDGLYYDDCGGGVEYVGDVDNRNDCGVGTITRTWRIIGTTQTCTQRITFTNYTRFDGTGIEFPEDTLLLSCPSDIHPDITGWPTLPTTNECTDLLSSYDDQVYNIVQDACYKIIRTWTVVDWCNSNRNTNTWTGTQVIKIKNTEEPEFESSCSTRTFNTVNDDNCTGIAELDVEVSDDCTPQDELRISYEVDLFKDGSIDYAQSGGVDLSATNTYPHGRHRICWTAEDKCGNTTPCCYDFIMRDGKKPTPYCRPGIVTVVMPTTGMIEIWASDLDEGSYDNCTSKGDLRFSFSSNVSDTRRVYTCADLDNGREQTFEVTIYVTDEDGNQDYCTTKVTIQDGIDDVCPDNLTGNTTNVSGLITTEDSETVEEVMVMLDGQAAGMPKYKMTGYDGEFMFPSVPTNLSYKIGASRNDDHLNGVSTLDLVLIQRHLLGMSSFNSPYKHIAADANNSKSVSAADISEIRKLILGKLAEFPKNESWRFVRKDFQFTDPNSPWPFDELMEIDDVMSHQTANDFIAIKTGDINGDVRPNNLVGNVSRSSSEIQMNIQERHFKVGENVTAMITTTVNELFGMQMALQFDPEKLQLVDIQHLNGVTNDASLGLTQLQDGVIYMSWNSNTGIVTSVGTEWMALTFEALEDGTLSESLSINTKHLSPEAYLEDLEVARIELNFVGNDGRVVSSSDEFQLFQNQPNPFDHSTKIAFTLPRMEEAAIHVFDVTGKTIHLIQGVFSKGLNEVTMDKADLESTGVLYYRLETNDQMATRKMIMIE